MSEQFFTKRIRHYILEYFAREANAPTSETIRYDLRLSSIEVERALNLIETQGGVYRDPQTQKILAAYPFSARPTDHIVRFLDGHWVYSMCAIDALGMPTMLNTDATIESRCAYCGKEIRIVVSQNALNTYEPHDARVWYMSFEQCGKSPEDTCIAALEQCPSINFFCSAEHVAVWRVAHSDTPGEEYDIERAFAQGVAMFGDLLK